MLPAHFMIADDGALYDTRADNWHKAPPIRKLYARHCARINSVAELKATLRAGAYAWPGGYPLYIVLSDGGLIKFSTAREELASLVSALRDYRRNHYENSGWRPIACEVLYESAGDYDAHTGEELESAYGNPEAENLDVMAPEDLREFAENPEAPEVLRQYAELKAQAMDYRASGAIGEATELENQCETIYRSLPQSLQW